MEPEERLPFLCITEVAAGNVLVDGLFRRTFGAHPPDYPRHILALYMKEALDVMPAGYMHLAPRGTIALVGGMCTDNRVPLSVNVVVA